MATANEIAKMCVYDSEGNVLLEESMKRLQAQFGGIKVPEKKAARFAGLPPVQVKDLETGVVYQSQSGAAKALFPLEHAKNHFYIREMYKLYPGRFARIEDGKEVAQGVKPVAPPADDSADAE